MRLRARVSSVLFLICLGGAALAQEVDCANTETQIEMTYCASLDYEAADIELNDAYAQAMEVARGWDTELAEDGVPAASILRDAQRAWLPFRDQACEAESLVARGGTLQNQLFYSCLARLTRARTESLRLFGALD